MTRYFEHFYPADPMTEISADDAAKLPYHAEEVPGPPLHYRIIARGTPMRVVYPGQLSPDLAAEYHGKHYGGLKFEVSTPPLVTAESKSWRQWHYDASGRLTVFLERQVAMEGPGSKTFWLDGEGQVTRWSEERYDDAGEIFEVVTYDAAGNVLNREDNV